METVGTSGAAPRVASLAVRRRGAHGAPGDARSQRERRALSESLGVRQIAACALGFLLAASGCSSKQQSSITQAATSPLSDLNIVQADIPQLLRRAQRQPYAMPDDVTCEALAADIRALDAQLGPDLDAPRSKDDPSLLERGATAAGNEAVGAIKGAAQDVVPFRHWVRQLTGAERYSNKVAAAIIAGTERRSFLKGMRAAQGCPALVPLDATADATIDATSDAAASTVDAVKPVDATPAAPNDAADDAAPAAGFAVPP